jgi:hypothetical protein
LGIVNWFRKEIENVDQKTRELLTIEGIHHPKADINRLYIKRQNGGCGLVGGVCIFCCNCWSQPLH